jgi:hypothetical protein
MLHAGAIALTIWCGIHALAAVRAGRFKVSVAAFCLLAIVAIWTSLTAGHAVSFLALWLILGLAVATRFLAGPGGSRKARFAMLGLFLLGSVLSGIGLLIYPAPASEIVESQQPTANLPPDDPNERRRRLALGTWQDEYQGKRTMVLKDDGRGTMDIAFSGLNATLFGPRMHFDLAWSIEGGHLVERTTGGEPAAAVNAILKIFGDRLDQPILELTADRLLLEDPKNKKQYDWRRAKAGK